MRRVVIVGPLPPGLRLAVPRSRARRLGLAVAEAGERRKWWQFWRWM